MVLKYKGKFRIESTRLKCFDYSRNGAYFVTICTKNKIHLFGEIENDNNDHGDYDYGDNVHGDNVETGLRPVSTTISSPVLKIFIPVPAPVFTIQHPVSPVLHILFLSGGFMVFL